MRRAFFFFHLGIFCRAVTAHVLVLQADKQAKRSVSTNDTRGKSTGQLMLFMPLDATGWETEGQQRATLRCTAAQSQACGDPMISARSLDR